MINKHISAEIPDPKLDPLGYALVAEHMMHGPCGKHNPKCPCMKNGTCSKHFPKIHEEQTTVDSKGFAVYKRGQDALFVEKGDCKLDNKWVIPYNMWLLKKYQAHIKLSGATKQHLSSICSSTSLKGLTATKHICKE
jgi:hypothetical protein